MLNFWKQRGNTSIFLFFFPSQALSQWHRCTVHKHSAGACSQTRLRFHTPSPFRKPNPSSQVMSTHVRMLGCNLQVRWQRGEWLRPRGGFTPHNPPPTLLFRLSSPRHTGLQKWAASRMRLSKSQTIHGRYKRAETRSWRWLMLQTEIWGTTRKKEREKKWREGGWESRGKHWSIR